MRPSCTSPVAAFSVAPIIVRSPTLASSCSRKFPWNAKHGIAVDLRESAFLRPMQTCLGPQRGTQTCRGTSRSLTMEVATHVVPTLYHVPWTCSSIPYQLLLELDIPNTTVDVITLSPTELRTSPEIEFLSPRRVVPFVAFPDGTTLVEVGAIVLYLCETFDKEHKLHPARGDPNRTRFFQGVVYTVAEGYRAVTNVVEECFGKSQEERAHETLGPLMEKFNTVVVEHLVQELEEAGRTYYLGEKFSVVDIMFGYILMTAEFADAGLLKNEVVKLYHQRLKERPAYMKLFSPATVS